MFIDVFRVLLGIPIEDHDNNISFSMYIVNTTTRVNILFISGIQVFAKVPRP